MKDGKGIPASLLDLTGYVNEGLRVLFVEDSDSDFELMSRNLRKGGLTIQATRVDTVAELHEKLEHEGWDVIISDHRLPGFSSEEALNLVRDTGLDIPFIIVSGNIGEDVAVEAMRSGADDYLMKDNLTRLVPAVERSLKAASERRGLAAAEQAQRESEHRFAAIAENIPGIIFQMQSGGQLTRPIVPFVSEGAMRLFGLPPRIFLENPNAFLEQFEPDDAAKLVELLMEGETFQNAVTWEGRLKSRGRLTERWVLLNAVGKPSGRSIHWDGVLLDITEKKFAEKALQQSETEIRSLSTEFESRREKERSAIAREIHDDMGGSLTKLKADIAWLNKNQSLTPESTEKLEDMLELVEHLLASSQRIAKDLRPGILDYGLVAALDWLIKDFNKRSGTDATFLCNQEEIDLDGEAKTALFRILQESLTNIVKHAQANRVDVELFATETDLTLEIRDDGVGIDNSDKLKQTSFGLRGMQERVAVFGGWVDVSGAPGKGTTVMVSIPRKTGGAQNND